MNTKSKGEISELFLTAKLAQADYIVLKPYGDNQRYDLVLEKDEKFFRVQCKTGRLKDGKIEFRACSSYRHRGKGQKDYRGQVEYFAVYCPDNQKGYLIPVEEIGISQGILRLEPAKNNQESKIRWAEDYEI